MPPISARRKANVSKPKTVKPPKREVSRFEKPRVNLKTTQAKSKKIKEEKHVAKPTAQKNDLCRGVKHDGNICTNKVAPGKRSYCKIHAPDSAKTDAKPRTTKATRSLSK